MTAQIQTTPKTVSVLGDSYSSGAIDWLFFWEPDHCLSAYRAEVLRRQYPEAYREAR